MGRENGKGSGETLYIQKCIAENNKKIILGCICWGASEQERMKINCEERSPPSPKRKRMIHRIICIH